MGRRSATDTALQLLTAFMRQQTWTQAELAEQIDVSTKVIRKHLLALSEYGMPLEREEDHPHVYWSVPKAWVPSGLMLSQSQCDELVRHLARLRTEEERERVFGILLGREVEIPEETVSRNANVDLETLARIEEAALQKRALELNYQSASADGPSNRVVSVQQVHYAPHYRFVGYCHRDERLKWYRVDAVHGAMFSAEQFTEVPDAQVDDYCAQSIDGFHADTDPVFCAFFAKHPDAGWVARNLPDGDFKTTTGPTGIRFEATTSGLEQLARFVAGLGRRARAETPELRSRVLEIARGTIGAHQRLAIASELPALTADEG